MNKEVFKEQPLLKTKRLNLKKLSNPDLNHMLEITSFNGRANTHDEVVKLLKEVEKGYSDFTMIVWGMYLKEELIGTIGFYRGFENEIGEVGYVTRDSHRRKGYLKEALQEVIEYAFEVMKLKSITAFTTDDNEASIGVLNLFEFIKTEEFSGDHRKYILNPLL